MRWIAENLAHAGKPVSLQEQLQRQQVQQWAHDQLQMQQAQLEAARAQREMYEAQTRMLQQQIAAENTRIASRHAGHADYSASTAYEFLNNSYPRTADKPKENSKQQEGYFRGKPFPAYSRQVLHLPGIQEFKNYPISYMLKDKAYPDVTKNQKIYVTHIAKDIKQNHLGLLDFAERFPTGHIWDLKGQIGIPPISHWALYKGEVVSDAYLANNAFGHAAAAVGMPLKEALNWAELFSLKSRNFQFDQPEDQAAIISGWFEYYTGDPWPVGLQTPHDYRILEKHYHEKYEEMEKLFQGQRNIIRLLEESDNIYKRK